VAFSFPEAAQAACSMQAPERYLPSFDKPR